MSYAVFVSGTEDYVVKGVHTRFLDTIYEFVKLLGE